MKVLGLSSVLVVGLALMGCSAAPPTPEEKLASVKQQLDCIYDEKDWGGLIDQIAESQAEFYQIMRVSVDFELEDYQDELIDRMLRSVKPTRDLSWVFLYEFSDCKVPGMQEDATRLGEALERLADASVDISLRTGQIKLSSWEAANQARDELAPIMTSIQSRAEEVLEQCEALAPPEDPDC